MRNTKIVCTIGPATDSPKTLRELMTAGMNVARLNFSHGTHESHGQTVQRVRAAAGDENKPIAILQDLAGPKIRTGTISNGPIRLEEGSLFTLTAEPDIDEAGRVSMNYPRLPQEVQKDALILLADGSIELRVAEIKNQDIICEVIVAGELSSHKGINLPGCSLSIEALTEKDKRDLVFGLRQGVDYVAMSFVRRKEDILQIKDIMQSEGKHVPIIAKIEKHEALENIDEIIDIVDGVMVARGDLAVETALEAVPLVQKTIIKKCNAAAKPVITATQMLKSMVDNPRPTRAEANDVANAVLDSTDAVMLSEETTIGQYPVEAVETMARIINVTEDSDVAKSHSDHIESAVSISIGHAVSHAAYQMAKDLNAAAILTPTQSGITPGLVSSYRPEHPIIALCPVEAVARRLNLVWGIYPIHSSGYLTSEEMLEHAKDLALQSGLVKFGEIVVITAGVPIGVAGTTNLIKAEVLE